MTTSSKTQRLLDIVAYLVGRRFPVSVDELMAAVPAYAERWRDGDERERQSARRSFERDKDELRTLGIPLETVDYTVDGVTEPGYRITRRDFYLPYLKLLREDAGLGSSQMAKKREVRAREVGRESRLFDARRARLQSASTAPEGTEARVGRTRASDPARPDEYTLREQDLHLALEALHRVSDVPGFAFRDGARRAFRKLAFDIDPASLGRRGPLYLDPPGAEDVRERVRALSDAVHARKRVRFRYHGINRGGTTERDVAGYGLLYQQGQWYLIGADALRAGALRIFRVGRMEDVEPNAKRPGSADYEVPDDFDLRDYAGRRAWELGNAPAERAQDGVDEPPVRARVLFRFPTSLWAERNGYGVREAAAREAGPDPPDDRRTTRDDGSEVRAFDVWQVDPFVRWILGLAGEAIPLEPPELVDAVREAAHRVAVLHGGGAGA